MQEHIKTTWRCQKSYPHKTRRPLEFQVGDKVFPKASTIKEIRQFNVKGKLSHKYIEPHEIIEKLNPGAYRLNLPTEIDMCTMFFISRNFGSMF